MLSSSLSMETSNSKAKNRTSKMWSWCPDGELMSHRTNTRSKLRIMWMNQRLVILLFISTSNTQWIFDRSTLANLNTTLSFALVLGQWPDMLCQAPFWSSVPDTAWYAKMELGISRRVKSKLLWQSVLFQLLTAKPGIVASILLYLPC